MQLFRDDGCFTDEGLNAVISGELDGLGRLEAAEHLAYCDKCVGRYTALLEQTGLEEPPHPINVMQERKRPASVRLMQTTWGRAAVAGFAAVLAMAMWRGGTIEKLMLAGDEIEKIKAMLPVQQSQQAEEEPERLGRPYGRGKAQELYYKLFGEDAAASSSRLDNAGAAAKTTNDRGDDIK